jgi:hypothetical protein
MGSGSCATAMNATTIRAKKSTNILDRLTNINTFA